MKKLFVMAIAAVLVASTSFAQEADQVVNEAVNVAQEAVIAPPAPVEASVMDGSAMMGQPVMSSDCVGCGNSYGVANYGYAAPMVGTGCNTCYSGCNTGYVGYSNNCCPTNNCANPCRRTVRPLVRTNNCRPVRTNNCCPVRTNNCCATQAYTGCATAAYTGCASSCVASTPCMTTTPCMAATPCATSVVAAAPAAPVMADNMVAQVAYQEDVVSAAPVAAAPVMEASPAPMQGVMMNNTMAPMASTVMGAPMGSDCGCTGTMNYAAQPAVTQGAVYGGYNNNCGYN
ncbi:MAG: hypothetical protein AAF456_11145 [Planctomycetota bacterium]